MRGRGGMSVLVTRDFVFTVAMGGWQGKIFYLRPRYRIVKTNVIRNKLYLEW